MKEAAHAAEEAVQSTISKYAWDRGITDEPEISSYFISQLDSQFKRQIGGLNWKSTILRNGKGVAAEEKRVGADILLHVSLKTPTQTYSKGVLIQSKRSEPYAGVPQGELNKLRKQCLDMLSHTPAAFVLNYAAGSIRCGPATRFAGTAIKDIHRQCTWTSYRFFLELFRCPVGDPRITSSQVAELPVPRVIHLKGSGEFSVEH